MADSDQLAEVLDRRAPKRGDQRREALLRALDVQLAERSLDDINIADLTSAAGVSRSAFYFYFQDKAACAAALGDEFYKEVVAASRALIDGPGEPREKLERMLRQLFAAAESHKHYFKAMIVARRRNPNVRDLWDASRASFVEPVAELIEQERRAGLAHLEPDSRTLTRVLLELNEYAIEQACSDEPPAIADRIEALLAIWSRAIYIESV
ncbi:TetR/AcrR family transcriptional regulator [Nocardia bovistercoris]|uniref:TetR/AcrR family transcriptional regulator n=1 Tax=Nocardia bovistercoris TaxID=2785916 RepID=A0A931IAM9_9NOCA|nr:TetR/AcrR family transcriptional regulator [Nocardia bovistercoris]MBH0778062.1 TetR/AcrR family transcriptional regulator [Nocardia bovistercoris]